MINSIINPTEYKNDKEIKLSDIIKEIFIEELHQLTIIILYIQRKDMGDETEYNQVHQRIVEHIIREFTKEEASGVLGYEFLMKNKKVYLKGVEDYIISKSGISQGLSFFELSVLNHDWVSAFIICMEDNDLKYYPDIYPRRE